MSTIRITKSAESKKTERRTQEQKKRRKTPSRCYCYCCRCCYGGCLHSGVCGDPRLKLKMPGQNMPSQLQFFASKILVKPMTISRINASIAVRCFIYACKASMPLCLLHRSVHTLLYTCLGWTCHSISSGTYYLQWRDIGKTH